MKTIKDFEVKNKKVIVRCDFNVPLDKKGNVEDDFRIKQTVPTIKYLIKNNAKIILISHLGSPEGRVEENLRLGPVQKKLEEYLKKSIMRTSDCIGDEVKKEVSKLKSGQILLLENLRFHKEEEENEPKFGKELAGLADIYINDAFGVSHRSHASVAGIVQYLPSGIGLLFEKEIKILSKVLNNPSRPFTAIVAGAKVESKIKVIGQFLKTADSLMLGGKLAYTILEVKGIAVGNILSSGDIAEEVQKINLDSPNLYMPLDNLISPDETGKKYIRQSAPADTKKGEFVFDIGSKTINLFSKIIKEAKMIIWSGPLGLFENSLFEKGTKKIAEAIVKNRKAYKIAGGGDTIFAISKFGLTAQFDHISTGGGAMLMFLGGEELPGLKVLE